MSAVPRLRPVPTLAQMRILVDRAERQPLTPAEAARFRRGIDQLIARRGDGTPAVAARHARLVRDLAALHAPMRRGGREVCAHCSGWNGARCLGVVTEWPCPTVELANPP